MTISFESIEYWDKEKGITNKDQGRFNAILFQMVKFSIIYCFFTVSLIFSKHLESVTNFPSFYRILQDLSE